MTRDHAYVALAVVVWLWFAVWIVNTLAGG